MKNIIKKLLTIVCLSMILVFSLPGKIFAQFGGGSETPFGGLHLITFTSQMCSCNNENSHWILDYRTMSVIKLYYSQGQSKVFANNNLDYGTWEVGTYSQGGAPPCRIGKDPYCATINNDGTYGMMPGTGTSMNNSVLKNRKFIAFLSPQSLSNSFSEAMSFVKLASAIAKAL